MSSSRRPPQGDVEAFLVGPLRDPALLVDRLVLALALAPRPGSARAAASPLAPAWRRPRGRPRRRG